MLAEVLALALASAPPAADLAPRLVGPLAPLQGPFAEAVQHRTPNVEGVRTALKALRALETSARPLLMRGEQRPLVHQVLSRAWTELEALETALAIDGDGRGPESALVRGMADARAQDAHALAAWELEAAEGSKHEPRAALQACWQEHLLSTDKPDALRATATLSLERSTVTGVEFAPALVGPRAHLGECLTTRLLGWPVAADADAVELPLRFEAPAWDSAGSRPEGRSNGP